MTVPALPKLSDVITEFGSGGSPANMNAYVRGGPYVPNNATNAAVSTTAAGLKLSQFAGTKSYTDFTLSANSPFLFNTTSGNKTMPLATVTATGGSGSFTYSLAFVSGSSLFVLSTPQSGRTATFTIFVAASGGLNSTATWRWTVNDGVNTHTVNFTLEISNGT